MDKSVRNLLAIDIYDKSGQALHVSNSWTKLTTIRILLKLGKQGSEI